MSTALPDKENVHLCIVTKGHLCLFNQALYPVEHVKWYIYALFIQDQNKIRKNCKISTQLQSVNMSYSLDRYLWAVSTLATEKLQIQCVMTDQYVEIKPPLQILDIGNGCEAFSSTIYITAISELTMTLQSVIHSMFFS